MDQKQITEISRLARIELSAEEKAEFSKDLAKILEAFNNISSVSTEGLNPMQNPTPNNGHLREDIVNADSCAKSEELLELASERVGHLYRVPPVV